MHTTRRYFVGYITPPLVFVDVPDFGDFPPCLATLLYLVPYPCLLSFPTTTFSSIYFFLSLSLSTNELSNGRKPSCLVVYILSPCFLHSVLSDPNFGRRCSPPTSPCHFKTLISNKLEHHHELEELSFLLPPSNETVETNPTGQQE
jgi:hypothetical protein